MKIGSNLAESSKEDYELKKRCFANDGDDDIPGICVEGSTKTYTSLN
jgi:hypothetical protein